MTIEFEAINRADTLRYMGYREAPDSRITAEIDECERELLAAARAQYVWRVFDLVREGETLSLSGCDFSLPGASIAEHLTGCPKAAVIAATLSADVDRFLKKQGVEDSLKAVISDALASALAEQTAEKARLDVLKNMEGYTATWCFAAGYGDFPIEITGKLADAVDASRKIGVSITESNMITPQKTIIGIIGLSEGQIKTEHSCEDCTMREFCEYRQDNVQCTAESVK